MVDAQHVVAGVWTRTTCSFLPGNSTVSGLFLRLRDTEKSKKGVEKGCVVV